MTEPGRGRSTPEADRATMDGATGRACWSSSRGRGRRQGHDHRRAPRASPTTREYHYVVTCTTRAAAAGRGRRRRLPLPRAATRSPRQRAAGGFLEANEVHGNWYGTPRDQVREALAAGRDVILKIDVQGAQVVKEQVPGALLIFLVPPSLEDLFQRLRSARDRDRRRARAPPAERRDRAGPPGGLRLRRGQRDRPGRADGRADRRDHRRRARPPPGPAGRGLTRGRLDPSDGPSRSRSTRPGRGGDRTYTYLVPEPWPTSSPARRCSSSSGGARRSGSCWPRPATRRDAGLGLDGGPVAGPRQADRRPGPGRRPAAARG